MAHLDILIALTKVYEQMSNFTLETIKQYPDENPVTFFPASSCTTALIDDKPHFIKMKIWIEEA